ncbi:MAG: MIP/aquaporin family protein [Thermoguttaceae bacterium]|jgi:glycerol uptake facilitator protein|nr:MIP/aquaporin family protein [Thermoguttaceae bacterium]
MNVYLAEFVGTAMLILLGNGVVANVVLAKTKSHNGGWIVITLGWALGVAFAVYSVGRISGAHINPAVTVALASIGAFEWSLVPGYIAAQVAGGFLGAGLVYLAFLAHWSETDDRDGILACFCTSPAVRRFGPAMITEFIGTFVLIFGVLAIGKVALGAGEVDEAWTTAVGTYFGPLLIGLLVLSIGISLGGPTGYAINPARDLGPRLAHAVLPIPGKRDSDWAYAWVPIVAPIAGGIAGAKMFVLLGL